MADVLVIGVGSDLHCDDAVGRRVVEEIERLDLDDVTVLSAIQLLPEHAEPMADAASVIVVDASARVHAVGTRRVVAADRRTDSHDGSLAGLLGLVGELGRPAPPATLVEVPAADLSLGDGLSDVATDAVRRAVEVVIDEIGRAQRGAEP